MGIIWRRVCTARGQWPPWQKRNWSGINQCDWNEIWLADPHGHRTARVWISRELANDRLLTALNGTMTTVDIMLLNESQRLTKVLASCVQNQKLRLSAWQNASSPVPHWKCQQVLFVWQCVLIARTIHKWMVWFIHRIVGFAWEDREGRWETHGWITAFNFWGIYISQAQCILEIFSFWRKVGIRQFYGWPESLNNCPQLISRVIWLMNWKAINSMKELWLDKIFIWKELSNINVMYVYCTTMRLNWLGVRLLLKH